MQKSESIKELAGALAKAQAEIQAASKDAVNPFFKSSYADLNSIWEACRKPLTNNGLSVIQSGNTSGDGKTFLETILMHSSGQWISGELPINPVKNDPQSLGSAITYVRRYALQAMVGVCAGDDDGHAASHAQQAPQPKIVQGQKKPSEAQLKRLFAIASNAKWPDTEVRGLIVDKTGKNSSKDLNVDEYNLICDYITQHPFLGENEKATSNL